MPKKINLNENEKEHYENIMNCMNRAYFCKRFSQLYEDWKKGKPGRAGSMGSLGVKLGVSDQTINNWRSKNKPSHVDHFIRICDHFKVPPEHFAPDLWYLTPVYNEERIKTVDNDSESRNIDPYFMNYVKRNFSIPHVLSNDATVIPFANRPPAYDAPDSHTVIIGDWSYFLDDQDLDLIAELQKKIENIIEEDFNKKFLQYEKAWCKWAIPLGIGNGSDPQSSFEWHTQYIIHYCPHLDPNDIISKMEKKWKMKYTRESLTDLIEID